MSKRRVVVTGMGMLSPVGNSVESSWKALLAGTSGIRTIEHFDASAFATRFAGMINDFNCEEYMSKKDARKMDLFIQYGIAAGIQALKDSGIEITEENASRVGVAIGSGIGGLGLIEANHEALMEKGPRKISILCAFYYREHDRRSPVYHARSTWSKHRYLYRVYNWPS
ncbi:3-oxoacyl-[acyl-carrier-protein] synthase [Photobacterium aphoticum]|uniref:3-oxoacyl-[acyl-carrier-protein] synthase n=1 Tax=Photobacterium aphoticum TaxID=754436 RepID=A0A090QP21_9GAMM|nr:3-oxoacyl-[acyl-carrier-protein] synthase [Photobacterium aphoticum]